MNYYNPYFYSMPTTLATPKVGLLTRIFGRSGATISSILNGTQRALNFANQAIPLVKQVRPMIGNAKTMFKVMNEFKRSEKPTLSVTTNKENNSNTVSTNNNVITNNNVTTQDINQNSYVNSDEGPTFFI